MVRRRDSGGGPLGQPQVLAGACSGQGGAPSKTRTMGAAVAERNADGPDFDELI